MSSRLLAMLAIVSGALGAAGCTQAPPPVATVPAQVVEAVRPAQAIAEAAPAAAAPAPAAAAQGDAAPAPAAATPNQLTIQGYGGPVPASWTAGQPSSGMRVAQYAVPAAPGAEAGELAAYFFVPGQGGSHDANIERWTSQFSGSDGKPVVAKISVTQSAQSEVTLVELTGNYARGVGMGPSSEVKPNQTLLIAMVETATGRITLQMYGPGKTVARQRDGFVQLARGFKRV